MRRVLAIIGLILAVGGFVMMPISLIYKISFLIPVGMIFGAFLILLRVKSMPSDLDEPDENGDGDNNE